MDNTSALLAKGILITMLAKALFSSSLYMAACVKWYCRLPTKPS